MKTGPFNQGTYDYLYSEIGRKAAHEYRDRCLKEDQTPDKKPQSNLANNVTRRAGLERTKDEKPLGLKPFLMLRYSVIKEYGLAQGSVICRIIKQHEVYSLKKKGQDWDEHFPCSDKLMASQLGVGKRSIEQYTQRLRLPPEISYFRVGNANVEESGHYNPYNHFTVDLEALDARLPPEPFLKVPLAFLSKYRLRGGVVLSWLYDRKRSLRKIGQVRPDGSFAVRRDEVSRMLWLKESTVTSFMREFEKDGLLTILKRDGFDARHRVRLNEKALSTMMGGHFDENDDHCQSQPPLCTGGGKSQPPSVANPSPQNHCQSQP